MESQIRRDGSFGFEKDARSRRRKSTAQKNVRRSVVGESRAQGRAGKKALEPVAKKAVVSHLQTEHNLSERRACRIVRLSRSVFRYRASPRDDSEIQSKLAELAARHPEFGFKKMFLTLRRLGHLWNHKRVYRVYCSMRLNRKRKHKRRVPTRNPLPLAVPGGFNQIWSADFMSDALWDGRRFRTFNVIDDFNREALAVEIDTSLSAQRVVRILDRIADCRGIPARIRFDNGPEFTALAVAEWAEANGVELEFIKPGKPMQNGFIERFNRSYREAVLNMYIFESLDEVRTETEKWRSVYNQHRPHEALGNLAPMEYLQKFNPETVI
jgi:putative transposase